MTHFKDEYLLSRQEYGELYPYISDDEVSALFWNGRSLWIDELRGGSYPAKEGFDREFIGKFIVSLCSLAGLRLGCENPTGRLETSAMEITFIDKSISPSGTSFILNKKRAPKRPDERELIDRGACSETEILQLKNIIENNLSIAVYGASEADRNELLMLISSFIRHKDRAVCVAERDCLYLSELGKERDMTELISGGKMEIDRLSKIAMSLNPSIIIYPEIRYEDVIRVMGELSDGVNLIAGLKGTGYEKKELFKLFDFGVEIVRTEETKDAGYKIEAITDMKNTVYSERVGQ